MRLRLNDSAATAGLHLVRGPFYAGTSGHRRARLHPPHRLAPSSARILLIALLISPVMAQVSPAGPPAVGVLPAEYKPITESDEFNGRIQARQRVDVVARVTAFLDEQLFTEGAEVKQGDLLYRLERGPFEADLQAKQAAVAQAEAQLENAKIAYARAEDLFRKEAGTQVALDDARATQRTAVAQVQSAQAQLRQSQITLDYTEIRTPIDGRIGRTSVTIGNVVGPTSGVLARVVNPDPVWVVFPVSVRRVLDLRDRYAERGGLDAVQIRLRLPNGDIYDQIGKLDFVDVSVASDTDTIVLRGTIANPARPPSILRELADDMFVTVILEAIEPVKVLAIPRAAILSDQQGDYVYVVNAQNVAEQRRVKLGQSTPETAAVTDGLKAGEQVIVEGIQRARPNAPVMPAPASRPPGRG
jgi:membrane fusion protein (multidrug efflux system)